LDSNLRSFTPRALYLSIAFTPNYYVPNQAYFSSGVNYSFELDPSRRWSIWHHNLTTINPIRSIAANSKPFIFEFAIPSKFQNRMLENCKIYIAEFYRFQDNLSSGTLFRIKPTIKQLFTTQNQTSVAY
jgi:hypothetical protein